MKKFPLRKMSKVKAKEHRKYLKLREATLSTWQSCEFPILCTQQGTQIHHMRGRRGSMLCDKRYWMILCHKHHQWIHDHARESRKMKLLK